MPSSTTIPPTAEASPGGHSDRRLETPVREFMRPGVIAVSEDASLRQAERAMVRHGVHAILLLGRQNGRPLGWVTARGLLPWMTEEERSDTLAFLEQQGLAYVSVDSPRTRASNVMPRIAAATHDVAYIRFHGRNWKTWNKKTKTSGERFDWLYSREDLEDWVEPIARLAEEAREVYAMFNNNRSDYAPRSAQVLRGLLDEAGVDATGGVEPAQANATLF
jgi:CBS domain-containing protein